MRCDGTLAAAQTVPAALPATAVRFAVASLVVVLMSELTLVPAHGSTATYPSPVLRVTVTFTPATAVTGTGCGGVVAPPPRSRVSRNRSGCTARYRSPPGVGANHPATSTTTCA